MNIIEQWDYLDAFCTFEFFIEKKLSLSKLEILCSYNILGRRNISTFDSTWHVIYCSAFVLHTYICPLLMQKQYKKYFWFRIHRLINVEVLRRTNLPNYQTFQRISVLLIIFWLIHWHWWLEYVSLLSPVIVLHCK